MFQKLCRIVIKLYIRNRIYRVKKINMDTKNSVRREAADWVTALHNERWNDVMQNQLEEWLSQSDDHRQVFQEMQDVWASIPESTQQASYAGISKEESSLVSVLFQLVSDWKMTSMAFGFVCILGAFSLLKIVASEQQWQQYDTQAGENKSLRLEDGSELVLGAATSLRWQMGEHQRRVTLLTGQVYFDIADDKLKPFVIHAGLTSVEVVGTKFDVRKIEHQTDVSVVEGHVRINNIDYQKGEAIKNHGVEDISLFAGDKLSVHKGKVRSPIEKVSINEISAWKNGRFVYRNADLAEVVSDARRYYRGDINFHGSDLTGLKVTTTFTLSQLDSLGIALEKILPIRVIQDDHDNLLIVRDTSRNSKD